MVRLRRVAAVPLLALALGATAVPGPAHAAYPSSVTVKDSRTSARAVDISEVRLEASSYYDSEQYLTVTVPGGFRPGHHLTVWFDLDGDSTPDGHYDLRLSKPKKPGGKYLVKKQEFRRGGGWDDPGTKARCSNSEDFPVSATQLRKGTKKIPLGLDLWYCLGVPNPPGLESGSWRVAVRVALGKRADMAPSGRGWSPFVAGWEPCEPSASGDCS
ncbi:hypothetical protein G5V58_08590 [Nocardioides anomalus]|uniref:M1 family metallopeptidase n=1 Tax=Nocardioides anomalus TaxID=2712223 RepID=A0A6G6WCQ3_9ACTN|nr:hypothetical protein [Nocardioides anomalus]QIG42820.1 hypothetical protein G5V58_08590 [Nocardioides anomalus]